MPKFDQLPAKELFPGFVGRFVHGQQSTLAFWEIRGGCSIPNHQHPHEQITHILEGTLEMKIGNEEFIFSAGSVHVIPPNTAHSAIAITNCKVLDAFSPARDDYRF
jgi:quercetin dioxygenase-like cupin family protein